MKSRFENLQRKVLRYLLRNFSYVFSSVFLKKNFLIVTGADSRFYASLIQLLHSITLNEPKLKVKVYDLGLTQFQINQIKYQFPSVQIRNFEFDKFPEYYQISNNQGAYAWKPTIIEKEYNLLAQDESLFWLDSGCLLRKRLHIVRAALSIYGFFSLPSGGSIGRLTLDDTIELLDGRAQRNKPMLSGGVVAFKRCAKNNRLVETWAAAALKREVIAPNGASKGNHRFDQSILSILYYQQSGREDPPLLNYSSKEFVTHRNIWTE